MPTQTPIQWCHTSVNPVAGCDGCELHPTAAKLREVLRPVVSRYTKLNVDVEALLTKITEVGPQAVMIRRDEISQQIAKSLNLGLLETSVAAEAKEAISSQFICYAAQLHRVRNSSGTKPGWAASFDKPQVFPGRVAKVARLGPPSENENADKPWLAGAPRLVFLSDMGDALSRDIPFETLVDEIIKPISTDEGRRHRWLWLTKRPSRMAEFSLYLEKHGLSWPDHLVAMTSVTSGDTVYRVNQLKKVRAKYRGLSVEPLWENVKLPLDGIQWVIVGGQSGSNDRPFHCEWATSIAKQCDEGGTAFFLKQLGSVPFRDGVEMKLKDGHGGEWAEWPDYLRRREIPAAWKASTKILAPEPCRKPTTAQRGDTMTTSKKPSTRTDLERLQKAENAVGAASKRYAATAQEQRQRLLDLCDGLEVVKVEYDALPKEERPQPTWVKYVASIVPKLKLTFRTARQADLYIALGRNYKAMPEDARAKFLDGCCTYNEMHRAIQRWRDRRHCHNYDPTPYEVLLVRARGTLNKATKLAPAGHKERFDQILGLLSELTSEIPEKPDDVYKPTTVREIAESLGGQTALGQAVGKQNGHASYWVRKNRLPKWAVPGITEQFLSKGRVIDLSGISTIN